MKVAVIGGGAVGLSCAYYLAHQGVEVILLEADEPGAGASRLNAGWVVPSMSGPVPSPEALRSSVKWMFRRDSPLRVALPRSLDEVKFLARMTRSCTTPRFEHGLEATIELNRGTHEAFTDLERDGVQFEHHRRGVLHLFMEQSSAEKHIADLVEDNPETTNRALTGDQVRACEPSVTDAVIAGIECAEETNLDPSSLVDGLASRCRDLGVEIVSGERIRSLAHRGKKVVALHGSRTWTADHFVLAAGVWSAGILRSAGLALPVHAGKGYGYDYHPAPVPLRHALYLTEHKVAVSPLNSGVRICGTMEFGPANDRVDHRRAGAIVHSTGQYLRHWPDLAQAPAPWAGLRPMTPDGLPILGSGQALTNLSFATGHAMLGITLAPLTGKLLAESIVSGEKVAELVPFSPDRFRSLRAPRP